MNTNSFGTSPITDRLTLGDRVTQVTADKCSTVNALFVLNTKESKTQYRATHYGI